MTNLTNTATETGRNDDDKKKAESFVPDDPWIDTFQKQLTPELVDSLRNYARMRAFVVGHAGRKVDDYYTRELVQDAIGDTWTGVRRWDPARCDLRKHLADVIKGRTDAHRKHAKDHRHEPIGDDAPASYAAECEASELVADGERAAKRVSARETMAHLRTEAADDQQVLRILDAYDAGAQTKDDVLAHTKMKARTYHNAHIRLRRIVRSYSDRNPAPQARA